MSCRLLCCLGKFHFLFYCLRILGDVTLYPVYSAFKKKLPWRLANYHSGRWGGAVHLVSIITGLDGEERRDEGSPNTAGYADSWGGFWECWGAWDAICSPSPALPLHLFFSPGLSFFDLCFVLISDLFVHLPTPAPDGL